MKALAACTQFIVASVPELANRTRSIDSIRSQMVLASVTCDSWGALNETPPVSRRSSASTTAGWAWPSGSALLLPKKSSRSTPSTSQTRHPCPRSQNRGYGSQPVPLVTPSGRYRAASSSMARDPGERSK